MPAWLIFVVLALGAYRLTRLIVKDDFPPVLWLRDHFAGGWRPLTEKEWAIIRAQEPTPFVYRDVDHGDGPVASRWVDRWRWVPQWLADLLSCAWCASGWVSLILIVVAALTVSVPAPVLMWPAVWAVASLIAARKWA